MSLRRWLAAQPPAAGWDLFGRHGLWAAISGALLAAACWAPGGAWPLIPCWFRALLHRPCPFCGLTRSVRAAGHGQWAESWQGAPLGTVVFILLAAYFLWHATGVVSGRSLQTPWLRYATGRKGLAVLALALLANWLYRWAMGFDRVPS